MAEVLAPLGSLEPNLIKRPWIVIFGGVTRIGNRRARRAANRALTWGLDVLWFDGYEESDSVTGARVRLKARPSNDAKLIVVGFKQREASTFAARLRGNSKTRDGSRVNKVWRGMAGRFGRLFRARTCWSIVRADVRSLSEVADPSFIVYVDDHTLTSAWYAGRIWRSSPICSDLPSG